MRIGTKTPQLAKTIDELAQEAADEQRVRNERRAKQLEQISTSSTFEMMSWVLFEGGGEDLFGEDADAELLAAVKGRYVEIASTEEEL